MDKEVIRRDLQHNQTSGLVMTGPGEAPFPRDTGGLVDAPDRLGRFERFLRQARDLPPMRTAVVHPCNAEALQAALEARDEGLITPVLARPSEKIHAAAEQAGLSISGLQLEATEHSHAAAAHAVALRRLARSRR